ncbi:MAG: hypothetical protein AAGA87_07630 [Pseudomonadota bacterium]
MRKALSFIAVAAVLGVSACGSNDLERGATGALIGGGLALATDNDPLTGAAVGATAGVLCDDLTNAC